MSTQLSPCPDSMSAHVLPVLLTSIVDTQYHTYEMWSVVNLKRNNYTLK